MSKLERIINEAFDNKDMVSTSTSGGKTLPVAIFSEKNPIPWVKPFRTQTRKK